MAPSKANTRDLARTEVEAMAHTRFTTLTEQEFNELGSTTKVRMYFLNKIARLQKLATKTDDGWVDIAGALLSTRVTWAGGLGNETDCQIYAMDRYGNLFVGAHDMGGRKAQTNHSSFCSGREVICAGNIFFWKGQLIHIDNGSGHYAPTRAFLRKAVEILIEEGTNPDILRVTVHGEGAYRARTFMQNALQGDWPQQDQMVNQDNIFHGCAGFVA